ncbi:hypothetical protein [Nocardioides sp. LHG3406-4]|uniref:hypothetical protein n=1 Tax=Nocardioides sp. LHG3406-4 TaxID=2804575 RepID=UPI003CF9AD29
MPTFPADPFTTSMAASWGFSRKVLGVAVAERRLVRLMAGLYVRSDVALTPLLRARAAALVVSDHSVVCDRTAAWIWGVDCFAYAELDGTPALETCVLRGHRATERPEVDGGTRDLRDEDWVILDGVRVTTPLRTAMDLGCALRRPVAFAAMEELMRVHGFALADLRRLLPRYFRRRGVVQLRQLVPLVRGVAESQPEAWMRLAIIDHGLPEPAAQHWVTDAGRPVFRLDLAYPRARIAIEYDGEEWHTSERDRTRDLARRAWLEQRGWTVVVLTKQSLNDVSDPWVTELATLLRTRKVA